jgi:hypothetical protein
MFSIQDWIANPYLPGFTGYSAGNTEKNNRVLLQGQREDVCSLPKDIVTMKNALAMTQKSLPITNVF